MLLYIQCILYIIQAISGTGMGWDENPWRYLILDLFSFVRKHQWHISPAQFSSLPSGLIWPIPPPVNIGHPNWNTICPNLEMNLSAFSPVSLPFKPCSHVGDSIDDDTDALGDDDHVECWFWRCRLAMMTKLIEQRSRLYSPFDWPVISHPPYLSLSSVCQLSLCHNSSFYQFAINIS